MPVLVDSALDVEVAAAGFELVATGLHRYSRHPVYFTSLSSRYGCEYGLSGADNTPPLHYCARISSYCRLDYHPGE